VLGHLLYVRLMFIRGAAVMKETDEGERSFVWLSLSVVGLLSTVSGMALVWYAPSFAAGKPAEGIINAWPAVQEANKKRTIDPHA